VLAQILNIDTKSPIVKLLFHNYLLMLSDLQACRWPELIKDHQILDFLVVDFYDGKADFERLSGALKIRDASEDFIAGNRHYALVSPIADLF
jgi:hypothetical protein